MNQNPSKPFLLYGLKEASGDEKRNSFYKRIRISNSFDLCMYPKVSKNDNARYIYRILLPLSQKAGREAFDNVDPLFAGL